ncbi:hypothetical protein [Gynurincola endophyticus]|uniref:hypothetical protein n=1 Tax=Gynurincola endophyticus TaxID=2479004 RepID=UPI000F8EA75B|nr:hypothetical protein [Gynurincola endophyticus]
MKKVIFLIVVCFFAFQVSAQVTDTLSYLQTEVVAKKNLYIGQPLSKLLSDLQIQPKSIFGGIAHNNKTIEPYTKFYYGDHGAASSNAYYITISWESTLQKSETMSLQMNNNGLLNTTVKNYYANKIIKDITVSRNPDFTNRHRRAND